MRKRKQCWVTQKQWDPAESSSRLAWILPVCHISFSYMPRWVAKVSSSLPLSRFFYLNSSRQGRAGSTKVLSGVSYFLNITSVKSTSQKVYLGVANSGPSPPTLISSSESAFQGTRPVAPSGKCYIWRIRMCALLPREVGRWLSTNTSSLSFQNIQRFMGHSSWERERVVKCMERCQELHHLCFFNKAETWLYHWY